MKKNNKKINKYVISDIHGHYNKLIRLFKKINFDFEKDYLFFLGDICDGGKKPLECIEFLLKIKNLYPCFGNHDLFLKEWFETKNINNKWLKINNLQTINIINEYKNEYISHILSKYFKLCNYYFLFENKMFCHAGFDYKKNINNQKKLIYCINRSLIKIARQNNKNNFKFNFKHSDKNIKIDEVFIGHSLCKKNIPEYNCNVICLDTGANNNGYLTIMDIDTKKYWQVK